MYCWKLCSIVVLWVQDVEMREQERQKWFLIMAQPKLTILSLVTNYLGDTVKFFTQGFLNLENENAK